MRKLSLEEIHDEQFKILDETIKYLDRNNITYYLVYGTLLGAVRHEGFIPWDDDVDIALPRPDFERLIELSKNNPISDHLEVIDFSLGNSKRPISKVINKNISVKSLSKEDKYLWIDLFVIDGLPDKDEDIIKLYKKQDFYKGLIYLKTNSFKNILNEKKSLKNRLLKIFLKPIAMLIPISFSSKKIIKLGKEYDFETSKNIGIFIWGIGICEKLSKDYLDICKVKFNGKKFNAYKKYNDYLKQMYGDYMKLPSIEKRKNHSVEAYRIGK